MPHIDSVLERQFELFTSSLGRAPQSVICFVPQNLQLEAALRAARVMLCECGTACGVCPTCMRWIGDLHPDMVMCGAPGEPPPISVCRTLGYELSLAPVVSEYRVGVVCSCDRLSPPAANSLLKVTEEPPLRGRILLLAEKDVIHTLQSRCAVYRIAPGGVPAGSAVPGDMLRWVCGAESVASVKADVESWITHCLANGMTERAESLGRVYSLLDRVPMSTAMAADMAAMAGHRNFDDL